MMTEEGYNGWANWETWNAHLWLTNDEGSYDLVRETVAATVVEEREESWDWRAGDAIKELIEEYAEEGYRLIGDEMTMHRVDWAKIGEAFVTEYREGLTV